MPTVSLSIPAWNRGKYISAAIGSVLRQTYRDFELVVFDDGSSDDTVAVARRAAGDDPRVRIFTGPHVGVAHANNAAAKHCTGKYHGWLDSDDAIAPTTLEETVAFLDANPSVGVVYTDCVTMDEAGNVKGVDKRSQIPYSKDRLLVDFMTFQFRLMRRAVFDQVGGLDESFDAAPDYDLCLRLSEVTQFAHLPRPLYLYRMHDDTISINGRLNQINKSREAIARALKRRGMDDEYQIDVELIGRFKLKRKQNDD